MGLMQHRPRYSKNEPFEHGFAERLWADYRQKPGRSLRNDRMESSLPVVLDHAERIDAKLPLKCGLKQLVTQDLSRHERLIVVLYYHESMTMRESGRVLDLSESRVSQMHASILRRLQAQTQHRGGEWTEGND